MKSQTNRKRRTGSFFDRQAGRCDQGGTSESESPASWNPPGVNRRGDGLQPRSRHRRGATAVEMALVLPLLLALVFGIIECGRAMMVQQILVNTAREAARRAVIPGATDQHVHEILVGYMDSAGIEEYEVNATLDGTVHEISATSSVITHANSKTRIGIEVSVLHSDVAWGPMSIIAGNRSIAAVVEMRKE